jgi:hypothetical protein
MSSSWRVAHPFASVLPTIDLSTSGMIPLGQLMLWLVCFGFGFGFELAGAPSFAPSAKGGELLTFLLVGVLKFPSMPTGLERRYG